MKTFRKILFWCHLFCGVVAGIVILTMSITGLLLTYEKQFLFWADTRNHDIRPACRWDAVVDRGAGGKGS
jgi:uncharacterized iron-regulated membrane protein